MKSKLLVALCATSALLAACGGGGDGNQAPRVALASMVNFGDSLSDVGSYKVGTVAALRGGEYSVNGAASVNWTSLLAKQIGVAAPCAAVTGLDGDPLQGFKVPQTAVAGCNSYAQGGSRVTNPVGPGNKLLGGGNAVLGQLTIPLVTQFSTHLAKNGGAFSGTELVTVLAGGNDVFMNLGVLQATVGAGGDPTAAGTAAVTAMGVAGAELAGYVKALVLAKGAKYVVVVNLPDVSKTPFAYGLPATTQGLIALMSKTFNDQLGAGLAGTPVVLVDAFTVSVDQAANPAAYGITNNKLPACDLSPAKNPLGSALICNAANLITGDVANYQFADGVHPTPYGYQLFAQLVAAQMAKAGWI